MYLLASGHNKVYIHIGMYCLIIDFRIAVDANNFILKINLLWFY